MLLFPFVQKTNVWIPINNVDPLFIFKLKLF